MSIEAYIEETTPSADSKVGADLYRAIFTHSNDPIAIIDPRGFYLEQNSAHAQLLGYTDEELKNRTPAIHLGDEVFAEVARELAEKGEYRGEAVSKTKAGETRYIELSAFAMRNDAGELLCYVGIKRDITSRKQTEAALQRNEAQLTDFFENSAVAMHWVGPDGTVIRVNQAELDMLGYERGEYEGHHIAEFHVDPGVIHDILKRLQAGEVLKNYEAQLRCKDGSIKDARINSSAYFENETFIHTRCFTHDNTERKRAQRESEELFKRERAARAEAEKANRLKDEFLATLSHELRTPLNAVIGWSRMLNSGRLDSDSSNHALEVIERNAWAQKQIIEDILDVSRVITGKLQLNLGPVDLVAVVDAALDAMRPALEAKDIKIETIIDASLRMVSGDADRLQQVVWNVLSNAAKFTPAGGQVEICVSQGTTHVLVQVKDSGPGIDPAFLPHVFERFRQADGSTTRTHGGLGLGLAIVRHLVELHGGTITVENRDDGPGASFTIRLPLPSGELRQEALVSAASIFKEAQSEPPSLEGLQILLVDDETDTLDLISVELAQYGAKVTAVASADEALRALEESGFDLLISDIGMPNTDGYDLIRQIRKLEGNQNQRIPAVALTAYARIQDRMRAILAGFSTHIAKPVEANELVTVVAGLAGRLGRS
ncbi:MAG TPA: PAS domain S-box protein [Pyrinomonadaceae bacterium]|nr:PAS domain S-box protein [Pyrinomonadaceae bacterium]